MLYGTNASGLAWTSPQCHFTRFVSHLSLVLPVSLTRHLHHNHDGVEEQAWIRPKRERHGGQTAASHARATMKIKSAKDVGGWVAEKKGKKAKSTPLHTALTSILSAPLTCKRIAERTTRSGKKT